ncbi:MULTISPECIES: PcfJ domain-containing protein [unclassified Thiocapsa]|uniref:PcfJ domain-containing protein n=1 Tax=unclassified Thiocapsa TaxID=2641286 RepID=UPI0035B17953
MHAETLRFEHWTYRHIGDAGLSTAAMTLLSRLLAREQLGGARAILARSAGQPRQRQTLYIDFGGPLDIRGQSVPWWGLWLVEESDRKLFCYAATHPAAWQRPPGGRVLNRLAVLDPQAPWIDALAMRLASRTLDTPAARIATPERPSDVRILARIEGALLRAALNAFVESLDPEILAAVRTEGATTPDEFNAYCAGAAPERRNRLQAARAYPWFAAALRRDWRLRRAVVAGAPLTRTLADHYRVQPRTIEHTRALARQPSDPAAHATLLKRLDTLPAEYLPRSEEDWRVFHALDEPLRDLTEALGVPLPQLLKPLSKGWAIGLASLTENAGGALDVQAIFAMMQGAYRYGIRPALQAWRIEHGGVSVIPPQAPLAVFALWFGRYGLGRLAVLARRWHEDLNRFSLARVQAVETAPGLPQPDAPLAWPALIAGRHSHGPYHVIELTSPIALEQEGHQLEHCVGTYAAVCLEGVTFIYAVRDRYGRHCSTFEVRVAETTPVLIQHKALRNSAPPQDEQALALRFIERVLTRVTPARLAAVCAERRRLAEHAVASLDRLAMLDDFGALTGQIDEEDAVALARLTEGLHPAEARREGIAAYLMRSGVLAGAIPDEAGMA